LAEEQHRIAAQSPRRSAGELRHGVRGIHADLLNRVTLQVAVVVAAGRQAEPAELAGDILRHLIQLGAGRVPAAHRVVRDDPDSPRHVVGGDGVDGGGG
jgi:hypothetical protein